MYLIVIGWLYVAVMMAVAEALHSGGSVLGVYMHGLFEDAAVLQALFGAGAPSLDAVFDQLAANVERAFAPGVLQGLIQ